MDFLELLVRNGIFGGQSAWITCKCAHMKIALLRIFNAGSNFHFLCSLNELQPCAFPRLLCVNAFSSLLAWFNFPLLSLSLLLPHIWEFLIRVNCIIVYKVFARYFSTIRSWRSRCSFFLSFGLHFYLNRSWCLLDTVLQYIRITSFNANLLHPAPKEP